MECIDSVKGVNSKMRPPSPPPLKLMKLVLLREVFINIFGKMALLQVLIVELMVSPRYRSMTDVYMSNSHFVVVVLLFVFKFQAG